MEIRERISLKPYTVLKVGGPAKFFAEAKNKIDVKEALGFALERNLPVFILGAGSNVLVSDAGFEGVVVRVSGGDVKIEGDMVEADAGVMMPYLANTTVGAGLSGLEWGVGVPGTLGGSVRGNAGCFGGETRDHLVKTEIFDIKKASSFCLDKKDCGFDYRDSVFKSHPGWIILGATFKLKEESSENIKKISELIVEQSTRRVKEQPIGEKTIGSTFKGVLFDEKLEEKLKSEIPFWRKNHSFSSWIFKSRSGFLGAGFLIELAGLKGQKIGGAEVSKKHANFIINTGNASSDEVVMLIGLIKERVHRKFGIFLEEEIQYVGFD